MIVRDGVAEDAEVAEDKAAGAKQHVRPRGEDQHAEEQREATGREEVFRARGFGLGVGDGGGGEQGE